MSCRLRLSLVTDVEYTFTAIFCQTEQRVGPPHPLTPQPHRARSPARSFTPPPHLPAPHPLRSSFPAGRTRAAKRRLPAAARRARPPARPRSTAQGPRPSLLPPPPPPRGPRGGARPEPGRAPHAAPELPAPAGPARPHPATPTPRSAGRPAPPGPLPAPLSPRLLRVQTGPARCPGPRHAHAARSRHPRNVTAAAAQEERRAGTGAGPPRGSAHSSERSLAIGGSR